MLAISELFEDTNRSLILVGAKQTIKEAKKGKISKAFVSDDCPSTILRLLEEMKVETEKINGNSEELAGMCRRKHNVVVASLRIA